MNELVMAIFGTLIVIVLVLVSMEAAESDIVDICEDQGYFIQGDKVVYCRADLLEAIIKKED
jgi:hypothetical protein